MEEHIKPGDECYFVNPDSRKAYTDTKYRFICMCPIMEGLAIVEHSYYTSGGKINEGQLERVQLGWLVRVWDDGEPKKKGKS